MNMEEQGTSRVLKAGTEDTMMMINKQPVTGSTYESGKDFFAQIISKNQVPSDTTKKSGFELLIYLIIAIGSFLSIDLVPLLEVYNQEHLYFASISVFLVSLLCFFLLLFVYLPCLLWNQFRRAAICTLAAVLIIMVYVTLVAVNRSYISLVIVPIIMLVFIGALCRNVSLKGSLKQDDNGSSEAEKAGDGSANRADGNCVSANNDEVMVAIALLPYCALLMGRFYIGNLVVSQFFLFISSTLGVLTLMVAWLPSPEVAPALEVLRRASLVVVVLTAHIMAGELLGEDVVLVCTPELVAALLWFSSHLGHGGTTVITIDKATSLKSGGFCLSAVMAILSYLARSIDESDEGDNLLVRYSTAVAACDVSGILLSLCGFALRQWPGETKPKASPSSELEGAIRLFNFWRSVMFVAAALLLIVWPLVDTPLGLQVQGLISDTVGNFLDL